MNTPLLESLITEQAKFEDVFFIETQGLGINRSDAEEILKRIPASVRKTRAIKTILGSDWRYEFGLPFHLDGNRSGFGVPYQAPLFINLIRATQIAECRLTDAQFRRSWWPQIDRPGKHFDVLVEMLAVASVNSEDVLEYEKPGSGIGTIRIDWTLETKSYGNFLLGIKNRPGQSAQGLNRIGRASRMAGRPELVEPVANFHELFKDTYNKFHPAETSAYIQGALIFLGIKVPGAELAEYFYSHLQDKFHFVAFGKEDKEKGICVNLLAITQEISHRVLSAFQWQDGADLMM